MPDKSGVRIPAHLVDAVKDLPGGASLRARCVLVVALHVKLDLVLSKRSTNQEIQLDFAVGRLHGLDVFDVHGGPHL